MDVLDPEPAAAGAPENGQLIFAVGVVTGRGAVVCLLGVCGVVWLTVS